MKYTGQSNVSPDIMRFQVYGFDRPYKLRYPANIVVPITIEAGEEDIATDDEDIDDEDDNGNGLIKRRRRTLKHRKIKIKRRQTLKHRQIKRKRRRTLKRIIK